MNRYNHILAKSIENGGTSLISHIEMVTFFAQIGATHSGLDVEIAKQGAILHDIGKVSPLFQKKLKKGFVNNPLEMNFRHEIASIFFLKAIDRSIWPQVIEMIIAHHKSIGKDGRELGILDLDYYYGELVFQFHAIDFDIWSEDAIGILQESGLKCPVISKEDASEAYQFVLEYCKTRNKGWSEWKGLLIGADHIASAAYEFKTKLPDLFEKPDISFYNRQHELFPLSLIQSDDTKKHTFVKAPTGAGKTDFLLKRCKGRIFYTLPFQASINAMFERIRNDLKDKVTDIRLLHSISRLIIEESKMEEKVIQDKFGAAIKVLTPHQLASIAFGTRGYEAVLFDLKDCDIILDEIHTYSDITQSIVLKLVEILNFIGCRIHIGTATMPTTLEQSILSILDPHEVQYVELTGNVLQSFNRHKVYKSPDFDGLLPIIHKAISEKQKVLVVCNRVANAQSRYNQLEELFPSVSKMLIHSRFKRKDRNKLETDLKQVFNNSLEACIVVSTQVVEVSLDISFDLMVTETAPIDALIQRFGRINRKRNSLTIGRYKSIHVIKPPETENESKPYNLEILRRSYNALPDGELLEEKSLQTLIDKVYPEIQLIDINLDAVFANNQWRLRQLWHLPKSALLEKLDIDSVSCITESDKESYRYCNSDERTMMEIPVNYNSVRWKKLEQCMVGSNPFIVPDVAYSCDKGLNFSKVGSENYDVNYQIL